MAITHASTPGAPATGAASKDGLQTLIQDHVQGWHQFTRFVKAGIIAMVLLLLMFLIHFAVGWGFAMFLLIVSYIALAFAVILGKV